jgi:hypothetical protein
MVDKQQRQAVPTREKALANEADGQCCHIAAKRAAALADMVLAKEQHCHKEAEHAALSMASSLANEQCCHEAAACGAMLVDLALAKEPRCRETATIAAMSAKKALAKECSCHKVAKQAAALVEQALTKEQRCQEAAEQAAELAVQALAKVQRCHEMAELAAMLVEMALAMEQRCHEVARREKALADEADKQCCHKMAMQEKALADDAKSHHRQKLAERTAAFAELVSAKCHQELVDCNAVLVETTLAKKHCCQEVADCGAMLRERAPAEEQRCSLLAEQAAGPELAMAEVVVLADLALPKQALAKDIWRQEEAATELCREDNECFMVPIILPNPVDVAIRRIRAACSLRAALLDALLAKIECKDIAHEARALPMTTSPHPAAMLSTAPHPMTYVGLVLATMWGSTHALSLALAPLAIPSPTVDGQLRMVRQCTQPRCPTSRRHRLCTPSPPDKVLPSHPHPLLGGAPTSTTTLTMLA